MATQVYTSEYTGNQVDQTIRDKVETLTRSEIEKMAVTANYPSTSKLYIAIDDNTVWRNNGIKMIQVFGAGDINSGEATEGAIPVADGEGGVNWTNLGAGVTDIIDNNKEIRVSGEVQMGGNFSIDSTKKLIDLVSLPYVTTEPTEDWTGVGIKIALLDSAPSSYKKGWLYLLKE